MVILKTQNPVLPSEYQIWCRRRSHAACDIAKAPVDAPAVAGRLK